ncbi:MULTISPECIES: hypothetical protein [Streptomyces]|uniref:Uncharacterized protein n=1 Tax=Streptomyces lienomycini TaxID=284035 RepID=A0ABV9WQD1_9ACTN|nr:hypothetical protein [Streptomyces sp. NBC_00334]
MRRKGGRRREADGQDGGAVEEVLDELYAMPPSGFVSHREERAAAARTAGRKEDARRIHAARRPTLAAWAANLLARSRPEETRRFLELGQALREAHRTLDAAGLRELSAQRRHIVSVLSGQAARLAGEAGQRLSQAARREVESTLRAVLADPDAADRWAGARLVVSLTPPSDFTADVAPAEAAPRAPSRATPDTPGKDELAERRRGRRDELARAEREAGRAEERLRDARAERTDAQEALRRTDDALDRARRTVTAAEERLREAREELDRAEGERRGAGERDRETAAAVTGAEREARASARRAERLATRAR